LAGWEGEELCPYKDQAGIPTIGIGSTFYPNGTKVTMADPCITKEQAVEICQVNLKSFIDEVNEYVKVPINQNQFDAVLDFTYNEGDGALAESTLLKRINANPSDPTIRDAFMMWVKVKENGVLVTDSWQVKRRTGDANLYFTPIVE